jgi:hypothetical protein
MKEPSTSLIIEGFRGKQSFLFMTSGLWWQIVPVNLLVHKIPLSGLKLFEVSLMNQQKYYYQDNDTHDFNENCSILNHIFLTTANQKEKSYHRKPWPFTPDLHPTAVQILQYLRAAVNHFQIDVRLKHEVLTLEEYNRKRTNRTNPLYPIAVST